MSDLKRILVVDDEPDIRKAVVFRLKKAGYETITAEDGEEALDKVMELRPDLIVLDWKLPGLNGGEVYTKLQESEIGRNIPVIFLTVSLENKRESLKMHGIDDEHVMLKPYDPKELLSNIEKLLGGIS